MSNTPTLKRPKTTSFSQYAMWLKCPMQWKLSYVNKLHRYEDNINTLFGTAVHLVIQSYLTSLYESAGGATEADQIDMEAEFEAKFKKEIDVARKKDEKLTLNEEEISEFMSDGKTIVKYFSSHSVRKKHFPSKKYKVIGVELPLEIALKKGTIVYKGYLDIVLREIKTGKIHIMDFKTSTNGWNKYQKEDRTKTDQLLLYKRFYSKLHNVPMSDIDVEFIILKRKLYEGVAFPQQRIQRVSPADGKISMKRVETAFLDFVNECFDETGEYNKETRFLKIPGKNRKNCKFCQFRTTTDENGNLYCDGKSDVPDDF
jgi:hypothetical protein